jgi:hypothetical protein
LRAKFLAKLNVRAKFLTKLGAQMVLAKP